MAHRALQTRLGQPHDPLTRLRYPLDVALPLSTPFLKQCPCPESLYSLFARFQVPGSRKHTAHSPAVAVNGLAQGPQATPPLQSLMTCPTPGWSGILLCPVKPRMALSAH